MLAFGTPVPGGDGDDAGGGSSRDNGENRNGDDVTAMVRLSWQW